MAQDLLQTISTLQNTAIGNCPEADRGRSTEGKRDHQERAKGCGYPMP